MKKSNLHITINKEDSNSNDFLYCWDYFSKKPSKTSLITSFSVEDFYNFLKKNDFSIVSTLREIYPIEDNSIVNKKIFSKNVEDVFISYTEYDIESDESIINEVYLYHKEDNIEKLLSDLHDISDKLDDNAETTDINYKVLSLGSNGLELNDLDLGIYDDENIELYYNDDIIKRKNKLQRLIQKNKKGISIIHGERGVGKTTLVKSIISSIEKKSVFVPTTLFETLINNTEFRTFLKINKDIVIILDDSELFFSEIYSKSNIFTNNLLQLVDGLDSDMFNLNIIVILNVENIEEIDHILLECNNLLDVLHVNNLDNIKAKELSKYLGKKIKPKSGLKLIDIIRGKKSSEYKSEIGFI